MKVMISRHPPLLVYQRCHGRRKSANYVLIAGCFYSELCYLLGLFMKSLENGHWHLLCQRITAVFFKNITMFLLCGCVACLCFPVFMFSRYLLALNEHDLLAFLSACFSVVLCLFVLWLHLGDPAPACFSASAPLSHLVHLSFINRHSPLTTDYESTILKNKQKRDFFLTKTVLHYRINESRKQKLKKWLSAM